MGSIRLRSQPWQLTFVVWPILPEKQLKKVQSICIILVTFKVLEEKKLKLPNSVYKARKAFKKYSKKQNYRSALSLN